MIDIYFYSLEQSAARRTNTKSYIVSSGRSHVSIQAIFAQNKSLLNGSLYSISVEPIGSAKPKFSEDISLKGLIRLESKAVTLVCPAQSFPLPSYRLVLNRCEFAVVLTIQQHSIFCKLNKKSRARIYSKYVSTHLCISALKVSLFLAQIFSLGFIAFQHSNTNKGIEF